MWINGIDNTVRDREHAILFVIALSECMGQELHNAVQHKVLELTIPHSASDVNRLICTLSMEIGGDGQASNDVAALAIVNSHGNSGGGTSSTSDEASSKNTVASLMLPA